MIKEFLNDHLDYIKNNIPDWSILVYKWFPNNFIQSVSNIYWYCSDIRQFTNDWRINLALIDDNKKNLIKCLLDIKNETKVLLYEELLILDNELNLESIFSWSIFIFENPIFHYYLNSSNELTNDIELALDSEDIIDDNEIFDFFYSNSTILWEYNLLQYKTIKESLNIKFVNFYETVNYSNILPWNIESSKLDTIFLSNSNDKFNKLLYQVFQWFNFTGEVFHFNYDDNQSRISIQIINELFTRLGASVKFSKVSNFDIVTYRKELDEILYKNWGYSKFRDISFYDKPDLSRNKTQISQWLLIEDIITQVEKSKTQNSYSDILITAPTWAWKSIIFQVPAIYLAQKLNLVTIVVSPLIALMYDQINSLKKKWVFTAEYINSEKTPSERENIIKRLQEGEISILYLSPESLLSYDITHFIWDRELGLLVIDEAHLVTTWWRDFRVDYWYLWNFIRKVRKYNTKFVTLALTATAVYWWDDDMVFETIDSLNMNMPTHIYIWNIIRDDIEFNFREFKYEWTYHQERFEKTKSVIKSYAILWTKTLVYCPYEKHVKELYGMLCAEGYKDKVWVYYWKLGAAEKKFNLDSFKNGDISVMIATKAFWMWIDIDDIKIVYHHAPSGNIPDYVQEIGRVARKPWITWYAEIDYCTKDLSYSKALHWLSSVKQFECKFVLDKIYSIFEVRNRYLREKASKEWKKYRMQQNFLVSVEDFSFILWPDQDQNIDNKLKNIFLLIEKDLLQKHKFNIVVARPKQLFTLAFISVDKSIEDFFLKEYWSYLNINVTIEWNRRLDRWWNEVNDFWNIYKIDLQKLWEERFVNLTFPTLKRGLYEQTLFPWFEKKIIPRLRLKINLKDSNLTNVREILFSKFSLLESVLSSEIFNWRYVKEDELDVEIRKYFPDDTSAIKIKEILLNFYTSSNDWWSSSVWWLWLDTFIQVKNDKLWFFKEYRIISSAYQKVKNSFIRHFDEMFEGTGDWTYEKYLSKNKDDYHLKIASVLELLWLWSYEVEWGEFPRIFIRINDPFRIKRITEKWDYINSLVLNIENRYKRSIKYIDNFFTKMSNEERWKFIESYFLGDKP